MPTSMREPNPTLPPLAEAPEVVRFLRAFPDAAADALAKSFDLTRVLDARDQKLVEELGKYSRRIAALDAEAVTGTPSAKLDSERVRLQGQLDLNFTRRRQLVTDRVHAYFDLAEGIEIWTEHEREAIEGRRDSRGKLTEEGLLAALEKQMSPLKTEHDALRGDPYKKLTEADRIAELERLHASLKAQHTALLGQVMNVIKPAARVALSWVEERFGVVHRDPTAGVMVLRKDAVAAELRRVELENRQIEVQMGAVVPRAA